MALFFPGRTECLICKKIIEEGDNYTAFGPFVDNEKDPLYFFNDAVFHTNCIKNHPLGKKASNRYRELEKHLPPGGKMVCYVCDHTLEDPDDFFLFSYLYEAEKDLHLSYKPCHETCLPKLEGLNTVYNRLSQLHSSGKWDGRGPRLILSKLKKSLGYVS